MRAEKIKNPRYKWADLRKLSQFFIKKNETIKKIYYFTSTAHWDFDKVKRHNICIKALRYTGIEVIIRKIQR